MGPLIAPFTRPQLAAIHFRQMVGLGKTRKQTMGAVMSQLAPGCTSYSGERDFTRYEMGKVVR
jgi:hypothetical protein